MRKCTPHVAKAFTRSSACIGVRTSRAEAAGCLCQAPDKQASGCSIFPDSAPNSFQRRESGKSHDHGFLKEEFHMPKRLVSSFT